MDDPLICLGCGGVVVEDLARVAALPPDAAVCACLGARPAPRAEAPALRCARCGGDLRPGARACPSCRATVATRRCDHCLAWSLADAAYCGGCGRSATNDPGAGAATATRCPRCRGALTARRYAELEVSECDACGGMHLQPAMMDRIVAARDASTGLRLALPRRAHVREAAVRYVRCPACDATMNRKNFAKVSGVVVDVCKTHGVWFDGGELGEVLAFIEQGGLERARARELAEIEDQKRALRQDELRAAAARTAAFAGEVEGMEMRRDARAILRGLDLAWHLADLWR